MGFLSVTIDLDEIGCYLAIHGITEEETRSADAVYRRGLPRAIRFFEEMGVKATFFAVGKELLRSTDAAFQLRTVAQKGHEIGNHTRSHPYNFFLLSSVSQGEEIDGGSDDILKATGMRPVGFRAPGYNINPSVIDLLQTKGYRYDSSLFPCPAYYAAKAGAIGLKTLSGRRSSSVLGDPRATMAPTIPYRMTEYDIWTRGNGLIELPITVVTKARLPFIGTSIGMMGTLAAGLLAKQAAKLPFVNLELHGIDFIDADGDEVTYLKPHQPDLRIPLAKRRNAIERAIKTLLDAGLEPVPLREAAARILI